MLETARFTPSGDAPADRFGFDPTSIAVGGGAAWITDGGRRLIRVDDGVAERIPVGRPLVGVAAGAGGLWAISGEKAEVLRIDSRTGEVTMRLPLVSGVALESAYPRAVAAGRDHVWVLNANTGAVTKLDPRTRSVVSTIKIGVDRGPAHLAADAEAVWVANEDGTLARVDAATDDVAYYEVGRTLRDVVVGAGAVWTSNRLADCCGQEE